VKLAIDPRASAELAREVAHYEAELGLGADLLAEVRRGIREVARHPERWALSPLPRARRLGVRHFVLARFRFTIEYAIRGRVIRVLAIAHMRRKPGYWLSRIDQRKKR
jgi:hypothetical protein